MPLRETGKVRRRYSVRMAAGSEPPLKAYRNRIVGQVGYGAFLRYELITSIFGQWPGGLGVWLRSLFYPHILR